MPEMSLSQILTTIKDLEKDISDSETLRADLFTQRKSSADKLSYTFEEITTEILQLKREISRLRFAVHKANVTHKAKISLPDDTEREMYIFEAILEKGVLESELSKFEEKLKLLTQGPHPYASADTEPFFWPMTKIERRNKIRSLRKQIRAYDDALQRVNRAIRINIE